LIDEFLAGDGVRQMADLLIAGTCLHLLQFPRTQRLKLPTHDNCKW